MNRMNSSRRHKELQREKEQDRLESKNIQINLDLSKFQELEKKFQEESCGRLRNLGRGLEIRSSDK